MSFLKFWKHKKQNVIIKQECHEKLSSEQQKQFVQHQPIETTHASTSTTLGRYHTHVVVDDDVISPVDDLTNTIILADIVEDIVDDLSTPNIFVEENVVQTNDFGGGTGGGAGAGDTWQPDPEPDFYPDPEPDQNYSDNSSYDSTDYSDNSSSLSDY